MGLVMRIVACEREKRQNCVLEASHQLRQDYPGFAMTPALASSATLLQTKSTALLSDLQVAGFFGEASK